ncbi:hypothetical protein GCM10009745_76690 [Kribbella yunnanensis]|uniref:Right handed beta helix domain-containing protein n=1 Tax=Kribbella yunnanensis TaxID=190194 RepID=A0ABP4V2R0_9ACTN
MMRILRFTTLAALTVLLGTAVVTPPTSVAQGNDSAYTVIATVNGDQVTAGELRREMARGSGRAAALQRLTEIKVQQALFRAKGIVSDTSYAGSLRQFEQENQRRAAARSKGEPVYGPARFDEGQYFRYRFDTEVLQLKEKLAGRELPVDEKALREYYDSAGQKFFTKESPRTPLRFDVVRDRVKTQYLDESYRALVRRLARQATVQFDRGDTALIAAAPAAEGPAYAGSTTYFVDSASGSDSNNGTSESTPWQSLAKVNSTEFAPGDTIRFRAGASWNGQLSPKGSGTGAAHIAIDRYGEGAKPRINGGGNEQGAVYLLNQPYWEIRNLDVTNNRGDASRSQFVGIKVHNDSGGLLNGVLIADNTVHDVRGLQSGFYGTNGGIAVVSKMNGSRWDGVVIERNDISAVDRIGIFVGPAWQEGNPAHWQAQAHTSNVTIQDNVIDDAGGDGILNFITSQAVVQRNVVSNSGGRAHNLDSAHTDYKNTAAAGIWSAIAENTLIQYNEVYNFHARGDGQGYDIDLGSHSTYVQYNYSHNNSGGFVLLCEIEDQGVDINDARIRFNISQNDAAGVVLCLYDYPKGPDHTDIMNNTVYLGPGSTAAMMLRYSNSAAFRQAFVYNNIFYTLGNNSYLSLPATTFDYNTFYGNHHASEPGDAHKQTADPRLVRAGSGYIGRDTVDGYKLVAGSPAIGSGTDTGMLGSSDYWGNPVGSGAPSRGAYNGPGVEAPTPNLAFNAKVDSSSSVECCAFFRPKLVDGSRNSISTESAGFSSAVGNFSPHEEWITLTLPERKTFSQITLYPRNDPGAVGRGFPQNFHIQVWNGAEWLTRRTVTGAGSPTGPQTYTWGRSDFTDRIRIITAGSDGLQLTSEGYLLQLAEMEVTP